MTDIEVIAESPCTDNCRLSDEGICLTCFRSQEEISQWHGASNQERLAMLRNAYQRQKAILK